MKKVELKNINTNFVETNINKYWLKNISRHLILIINIIINIYLLIENKKNAKLIKKIL